MASTEHLELSAFIKDVHKSLREKSYLLGEEKAWKEHCNDKDTLERYAKTMEQLASQHWQKNQQKECSKALSRIEWIYNSCMDYFKNGGIEYQRKREEDIASRNGIKTTCFLTERSKTYKLLDVGSCYNPFKKYKEFDVLPIDLAPSNNEVMWCDFLNVDLSNEIIDNTNTTSCIKVLQTKTFEIIVFSLLLEYFPAPSQRLTCCSKAYDLLKAEGILLVVTPDSKHVGANAKLMKSWRFVLAKLGFCRIKYEKLPYLHCMVFRKSVNPDVAQRWATLNKDRKLYDEINIPQDFNDKGDTNKV